MPGDRLQRYEIRHHPVVSLLLVLPQAGLADSLTINVRALGSTLRELVVAPDRRELAALADLALAAFASLIESHGSWVKIDATPGVAAGLTP